MKYISTLFMLIVLLIDSKSTLANERRFTYTYETLTLPPGVREIEIWNTYRTDRDYFYRRMDQRIEFEFGVTDNLMAAFYLNSSWLSQDSNGEESQGEAISSQEISISSEWKYKILDRVADPIGFGLYGEATIGLNEFELEGKILLDKQVNSFLVAFNGVIENEWETELEKGITENESELLLEFDLGIAYLVNNAFSLGIEVRNHNEVKESIWEYSALFAGPVISYATESWWATFTLLPQVTSFKGGTNGNLVLDEHEKFEARLLFSFHL